MMGVKEKIFIFIFFVLLVSCNAQLDEENPDVSIGVTEVASDEIDQSYYSGQNSSDVIDLEQLQYQGAFRLPGGWESP